MKNNAKIDSATLSLLKASFLMLAHIFYLMFVTMILFPSIHRYFRKKQQKTLKLAVCTQIADIENTRNQLRTLFESQITVLGFRVIGNIQEGS